MNDTNTGKAKGDKTACNLQTHREGKEAARICVVAALKSAQHKWGTCIPKEVATGTVHIIDSGRET